MAKAWEEIRSFISTLSFFRLLSGFEELVDIIYYYSLYFGVSVSLCKQLALQLSSLISPIIDFLPVLPESKAGSVSEHPGEG